jgi:hypothetical protein
VEYSSGVGISAPYIWSADSLPLEQLVPGATRETALLAPDARRLPVRSAVVDGITEMRVENLDQPGIYTVADEGPALAINMLRKESDLTPLGDGKLEDLLKADSLYLATDAESLKRLIEEHRIGRTFGEHILWIVLLMIIGEFVYANHLARARPVLSDQLNLEPSGRVKGHPEAAA